MKTVICPTCDKRVHVVATTHDPVPETVSLSCGHLLCDHDWQEQPGEPPVDVCSSCGAVRE